MRTLLIIVGQVFWCLAAAVFLNWLIMETDLQNTSLFRIAVFVLVSILASINKPKKNNKLFKKSDYKSPIYNPDL